jgi:hypothetical protein
LFGRKEVDVWREDEVTLYEAPDLAGQWQWGSKVLLPSENHLKLQRKPYEGVRLGGYLKPSQM